jgi:hypothetical protein
MASRYLRDLNNAVGAPLAAPTVPRPALLNPGLDPTLAGGSATGVANATTATQLLEAAAAIGVATDSVNTWLLDGGSAIGVAVATASDQEAEAAAAAGIAVAGAYAQLEVGGSAIGEADGTLNIPIFVAVGIANAWAATLLFAGGSATGEADAFALAVLGLSSERIAFLQDWTSRHLRYPIGSGKR